MKKIGLSFLCAMFTCLTFATELKYQWTAGKAYHFSAEVEDDVNTTMMGMSVQETFTTQTDFYLSIESVDEQGSAQGVLYLINYVVQDSKGHILASLSDIPRESISGDVKVDAKGNFTFLKKVYLISSASGNVLAYGKADENSASVGGQAGNIKVDAYAEFDPATGSLKAGYNVQEIKNTTEVEVKITEDTDMLDVFPYSFLELLVLPEGDIQVNDEIEATTGMYKMKVKVESMENGVAALHHSLSTDKNADMFDGGVKAKTDDGKTTFDMDMDADMDDDDFESDMDLDSESMDFDMDMDMSDMSMSGFDDMDEEDKADMEMAKSMSPDMTCGISSYFDYGKGMFKIVAGTVTTKVDMMGVNMTVVSRLKMKLNG